MSQTRGGMKKGRHFVWRFEPQEMTVLIENEKGKKHKYSVQEIERILRNLYNAFWNEFFPLANDVEKLNNGSERLGLGRIILEQREGDIYHAQGSSYLGVVMEECEYFQWNGKHVGIGWRLVDDDFSRIAVISKLQRASGQN